MCGRFSLTASAESLIQYFKLKKGLYMKPRYNIAPGEFIPLIRTPGEIEFLQWGFKPHWMNQEKVGSGFMNARIEDIQQKPAFREAFQKKRCLIVADGYYEWKLSGRIKQPYYFRYKNQSIFVLAGIWDGDTCAILTTKANTLFSTIHERMPIILPLEAYDSWLKSAFKDIDSLLALAQNQFLEVYPVSTQVNNTLFEGPDCIRSLQN